MYFIKHHVFSLKIIHTGKGSHTHQFLYYLFSHGYSVMTQIMEYPNLLGQQYLGGVLPAPQDLFGMTIHGTLILSSRSCHAVIASGAPRTLIRSTYARGVGFFSVPRPGPYAQRPDGFWYRTIEYFHPSLRICVQGMHWRVRAVEADTGPYDLILGADWLHEHRVLVDVFGRSISMEAPGGRAVLQFEGHPAILTLVQFIVAPPPEP